MASAAPVETWTIGQLLTWTTTFFAGKGFPSPRLDAELLLAHVLSCPRIKLYMYFDTEVSVPDRARFRELVRKRGSACPVAYLIGVKEFFSLEFEVTPEVLIPRPETETLVELALAMAKQRPVTRFVDVGVGSGAIAITLAKRWPDAHGIAVDASATALAVARRNADRHGVADRLRFVEGDLFPPDASETFDLIVSNPPYVASEDLASLPADVRDHEPRLALDGGPGGLRVIERLFLEAANRLRPDGTMLIEIGHGQDEPLRAWAAKLASWRLEPTSLDAAGVPRVVTARPNDVGRDASAVAPIGSS